MARSAIAATTIRTSTNANAARANLVDATLDMEVRVAKSLLLESLVKPSCVETLDYSD